MVVRVVDVRRRVVHRRITRWRRCICFGDEVSQWRAVKAASWSPALSVSSRRRRRRRVWWWARQPSSAVVNAPPVKVIAEQARNSRSNASPGHVTTAPHRKQHGAAADSQSDYFSRTCTTILWLFWHLWLEYSTHTVDIVCKQSTSKFLLSGK